MSAPLSSHTARSTATARDPRAFGRPESARAGARTARGVSLAVGLACLAWTALGCGVVRTTLPQREFVPATTPMPIDGLWRLVANEKIYRVEAGRIWLTEPATLGPLRYDPGQVVTRDIRQVGPRAYEGRDLGSAGRWRAIVRDGRLETDVLLADAIPTHYVFEPVELDDATWFERQVASDRIVSPSGEPVETIADMPAPSEGGPSASRTALAATPPAADGGGSPDAAARAALAHPEIFGRYHALVIGNDRYASLPALQTAVNDARAVARMLREDYAFDVRLLEDATRAEILTALRDLRETLDDGDNLLIYYAGHGWLDRDVDEGYWLPVDAERDSDVHWISNATITGYLRAIRAKHVIVVADSCYSGTLTRGIKLDVRTPDYLERMARLRARVVLSSGGLEPVSDAGGEGHSAFARSFLDALVANVGVVDSTTLFAQIRRPVMLRADQQPELADIRKAGHEGGDFLFIRTDGGN